jgi:hypothetical protein
MLLDIMHVGLEGAPLPPGQQAGLKRCFQPHATTMLTRFLCSLLA